MTESKLIRSFARLSSWSATLLQPLAALITRLVLGEAFILTGLGKWKNFERTTAFFAQIGIPQPKANAAFIATLELVGGACLVLGFGTRIFSLLLSATMVVALLTADRESFLGAFNPSAEKGFMDVTPFVFLMFLVGLAAWGAGPVSADRILFRKATDPA